jgi:hypothetical protein
VGRLGQRTAQLAASGGDRLIHVAAILYCEVPAAQPGAVGD